MIRHSFGSTYVSCLGKRKSAPICCPGCHACHLCRGVVAVAINRGGGSAICRQAGCRDEGQATSERPAVLADREFSDAGAREGRCR